MSIGVLASKAVTLELMQETSRELAEVLQVVPVSLTRKKETIPVLMWRICYANDGAQRSQVEQYEVTHRLEIAENKTKQSKAKQNKTKQNKTNQ